MEKEILAHGMGANRAALNGLLDPGNVSVELNTQDKVALTLNKYQKVELL